MSTPLNLQSPPSPVPPSSTPASAKPFPFAEVCCVAFCAFLIVTGAASPQSFPKHLAYALPFLAGVLGIAASHVVYPTCKPLFNALAIGLLLLALALDFTQTQTPTWEMRLLYVGLVLFALAGSVWLAFRKWGSSIREWDVVTRRSFVAAALMWVVAVLWIVTRQAAG